MNRNRVTRATTQVIVAIGILMTMLLAGGAPGDFANRVGPTPTLSR